MYKHVRYAVFTIALGLFTFGSWMHETRADEPQRPSPQKVEAFTNSFFRTLPDYTPGNLITKTQVEELIKAMFKNEWVINTEDRNQLLKRILDDNAFLVKELNTTDHGRGFLRKIKNYPGGVDRLDKIAQMPKGKRDVHAMIYNIPNGDDWIKGMTTTEHGRRLGESISHWQRDDFNKNTGRIYTVEALAPELSQIVRMPQRLIPGQPLH